MQTEKSAGAVVYRVIDNNIVILLLQAAPGKPWGFPKGKMDAGETEEQAALREIAEETGIKQVELAPGFRHVIHYHFRRGKGLVYKDVVYFLARVATEEVRISWEHFAFRWVPISEAFDLVIFQNARETLQKASEWLAGR